MLLDNCLLVFEKPPPDVLLVVVTLQPARLEALHVPLPAIHPAFRYDVLTVLHAAAP